MNNTQLTEEEVAASLSQLKEGINLSTDKAKSIISGLVVTPVTADRLISKDQGRSIISNFISPINVFMSTTAKIGLVALVLVLAGVFGYSQLGSNKPADLANTDTDQSSVAANNQVEPVANGDIDGATSAILASATSEGLILGDEESDASLIAADSQELQDLSQSITDNDI